MKIALKIVLGGLAAGIVAFFLVCKVMGEDVPSSEGGTGAAVVILIFAGGAAVLMFAFQALALALSTRYLREAPVLAVMGLSALWPIVLSRAVPLVRWADKGGAIAAVAAGVLALAAYFFGTMGLICAAARAAGRWRAFKQSPSGRPGESSAP